MFLVHCWFGGGDTAVAESRLELMVMESLEG